MLHCLYTDMGCISAILLYFVSITQEEFVYTEDTTAYNAPYGMALLKNHVSLSLCYLLVVKSFHKLMDLILYLFPFDP